MKIWAGKEVLRHTMKIAARGIAARSNGAIIVFSKYWCDNSLSSHLWVFCDIPDYHIGHVHSNIVIMAAMLSTHIGHYRFIVQHYVVVTRRPLTLLM